MPIIGLGLPCFKLLTSPTGFLLVARPNHTTGSRNIKPEVVSKVQKMARYASFCLIMGPFKGEAPVFARLWPVRVRVRVNFTTEAVRSAILATAGSGPDLAGGRPGAQPGHNFDLKSGGPNSRHLRCRGSRCQRRREG